MKTKLSKKRAISTVLTTVIILVSSVVLGTGTILYGTSLFELGARQESLTVYNPQIWVHTTNIDGLAWGAADIRNSGDTLLGIDLITVRGTPIPFAQWYIDLSVDNILFTQSLNFTGWSGGGLIKTGSCSNGERISINNGFGDICGRGVSGPFVLEPSDTAIIYFQIPNGTLTSLDSGISTSVNIYASKAGSPQSVIIEGRS